MNTIRNLFKSPEQKAAEEFVQCRKEMSSLPTGSMGSKLVQALGGDEAFCSLPKLAWERSFGPSKWFRELCYDVPSYKMRASVMRGKNSQGAPVVILRKRCSINNYEQHSARKNHTFFTSEVISPKWGDSNFDKDLLTSTHFHVDKTPHIHSRDFDRLELEDLSQLLAGKEVTHKESWFHVHSRLV